MGERISAGVYLEGAKGIVETVGELDEILTDAINRERSATEREIGAYLRTINSGLAIALAGVIERGEYRK